jgi:DNA repair exonuclease SbcCD nuclease subunit
MAAELRILLLGDSHLGFDLPVRPRTGRRRRGNDFLANYAAALAPAVHGEVDVVVHAGDVFNRSQVVTSVAYQAYDPLRRIADRGIPVYVVPGNHERSRLPHVRLLSHSNIHVFDRPRTFTTTVRGTTISFSGFPYERHDVRSNFRELVQRTEWQENSAAVRFLCIHHCVEGATCGPGNFMFTTASDVIRAHDIGAPFAAVFTGHIHRHQVLRLRAPVLYPASIERTSFAEIDEPKGFMIVHVAESEGDHDVRWEFRHLPARPMLLHTLSANDLGPQALESAIHACIDAAPRDGVLAIRVDGTLTDAHWRVFSSVRAFVPVTMNVEIKPGGGFVAPRSAATRSSVAAPPAQLSFY